MNRAAVDFSMCVCAPVGSVRAKLRMSAVVDLVITARADDVWLSKKESDSVFFSGTWLWFEVAIITSRTFYEILHTL